MVSVVRGDGAAPAVRVDLAVPVVRVVVSEDRGVLEDRVVVSVDQVVLQAKADRVVALEDLESQAAASVAPVDLAPDEMDPAVQVVAQAAAHRRVRAEESIRRRRRAGRPSL